ncbi:hypothetical protein DY000_02002385 [Brassica cretica]|uniref:Uncharacterized protein n=1 Tax=Brassica cretica TaxID=69181 RepID=A0ABQ7BW35_BRACR|nr:hypothetical protein DY000_02002385 [Brassica cretica]
MEDSTESQAEKSDSLHGIFFGGKKVKIAWLKFQARADDEEDAEGVYLQHQQCYPCEGSDMDYICDEFDLWLDCSSKEFNCLSLSKVVYMGLVGLWL